MRGVSHAVTGMGAWTFLAAPTSAYLPIPYHGHTVDIPLSCGLLHLPNEIFLGGYIPVAGASMVPDSDHPQGTIAHSVPGVSKPMCQFVNQVSGGHRHGTHSFVGIGVMTLIAWLSTLISVPIHGKNLPIGAMVLFALLCAFAIKALRLLRKPGWVQPWLLSIGMSVLIGWFAPDTAKWFPLIMAVGCFIHCVGDSLTTGGCPWFWPWIPKPPAGKDSRYWHKNGWMGIPILGDTDTGKEKGLTREKSLSLVILVYSLVTLVAVMYRLI